jgi:LDH2 family malate/lactate/ureidoglycolate dehydrogenase
MTFDQDHVNLSLEELHDLGVRILTANGMRQNHAEAIARVIVAGQRDECHSHGAYRLLVCVRSLRAGKLSKTAEPEVVNVAPAVVKVDAKFAYSQLAFERGLPLLVEKARNSGVAALVINNCFHFSALWPEVEQIAEMGLAGLAMTPSHSWVAPEGGSKPLFGTNPIAFAFPRNGEFPFVFDFATSTATRGDLELHRRADKAIPLGWAVDETGQQTTSAEAAFRGAMTTFGGHKGSALCAMIELLAGALIGDLSSVESLSFDEGAGATPCHGELILAFDPVLLGRNDPGAYLRRVEELCEGVTGQGARLPSQRRFDARKRSLEMGVTIPVSLYNDLVALLGR